MAKADSFRCRVITPERMVLDCAATFAAFPAHDGEMGVLLNRAPMVCKLGTGPLRVQSPDQTHTLFVDGGFAQVVGNKLTILTEQAKKAEELDAAAANQAMVEARAMKTPTLDAVAARASALKRAQVQLKLIKGKPA